MTTYLNPPDLGDFSAVGLSSGTATDSLVFTAGLALDPVTLRRRSDVSSIGEETTAAIENIRTVLREAGLDLQDIVKTTCYLSDDSYRSEFMAAYTRAFGEGPYPARCTFVIGLVADIRVQIEAVAVRPEHA